jgi:hypothetical protein
MDAVAIVSITIAVTVIIVLAVCLIALAVMLRNTDVNLRAAIAAMREVGPNAEPLKAAIEPINIELDQLRRSLERFVGREQEQR